jgi:hypothetical protein
MCLFVLFSLFLCVNKLEPFSPHMLCKCIFSVLGIDKVPVVSDPVLVIIQRLWLL